jgi:hypothetical protein
VQSRERAARLLAEAHVELVERDGRTFTLRRLAGAELDERPPVAPRRSTVRAVAIA